MKKSFNGILFMIFVGSAIALRAQEDCSQKLIQAERAYYTGRFGDIQTLLAKCLASGFDKEQRTEAYRLMALSAIFSRNFERADSSLVLMLKTNPQYEFLASDPPEFKKRVEDFYVHPLVEVTANVGLLQPLFNVTEVYNPRPIPATVIYKGNTGTHYGLMAAYYFNKNISVRAGYEWQQYSFTIENSDTLGINAGLLTEKQSRSQWQTAIGYNYNFKRFSLQAYAGVIHSTLQKADGYLVLERKNVGGNVSDEIVLNYSNLSQRTVNELRPLVELRANVPQKDKWMFSLSVRYELGIQNRANPDNRFSNVPLMTTMEWIEDDFKSSTLVVSFGISKLFYRIKLK